MTANLSSPNLTLSSSQWTSHRKLHWPPRPPRRQEFIFGGGRWRQMSLCAVCESSKPTWKGPLGDSVCLACIDELERKRYT